MARFGFAWWALRARFKAESQQCPYCLGTDSEFIGRKWLLIEARRCRGCGLIFRWPSYDSKRYRDYYRESYHDDCRFGSFAGLPSLEEVTELKKKGIAGSSYDRSDKIDFLSHYIKPGARILDYGSSWGYTTRQFVERGFEAVGFDLSEKQARFGADQLGLRMESDFGRLVPETVGMFDAIYAHWMLEHCHRIKPILERFSVLTKPGGVVMIVVPNAAGVKARQLGVRWGPMIGETHSIAFEPSWFEKHLPEFGFETTVFSDPIAGARGDMQCKGEELFCIGIKK